MAFPSIFRGHPAGAYLVESGDPFESSDRAGFAPRIDVVEREAEYQVTAELPGLEEKDFQLEVHRNLLTISGEKRVEQEGERKGWRWSERAYGRFRRSVQLPADVATDKASASFKGGLLTVTLPKAESARVRNIPVTTAG
jgi:HSP20 family protein